MRLREIKHILLQSKDAVLGVNISPQDSTIVNIANFDQFLVVLKDLKKIELLDFAIDPILNDPEFGKHLINSFNITSKSAGRLRSYYDKLKESYIILEAILDKMVSPQPDMTLSIKIYDLTEFKEIQEFTNNFYKKILAPLNYLNIKVEVGELETGSRWINITIGSYLGLKLITAIFSASFDILIHDYQKLKIASEIAKQYEDENNELNGYRKFLERQIEDLYIKRANLIFNEMKDDVTISDEEKTKLINMTEEDINELRVSLSKSLEETTNQINKGLEIYQALDKPTEDRYQIQLPDFSKLLSLKKEGKLLIDESRKTSD